VFPCPDPFRALQIITPLPKTCPAPDKVDTFDKYQGKLPPSISILKARLTLTGTFTVHGKGAFMTRRTAFLIFFFGTLISAVIFLLLTLDFHRKQEVFTNTSQLTESVVAGKNVWKKYNCNDCHTILGFGGYYAPDMTKAYFRLGKSNIIAIVTHPEKVYKDSFRKMPNLGVTVQEAEDLVEFLKWTGNIENRQWPPQDEKYVAAYRMRESATQVLDKPDIVLGACGGCHSFENQGRNVAGDFNDIAREIEYSREQLVNLMLDPESVNPGLGMPPQDISRETAQLIADFILSLK
jgi:nitric oxide reductase subunit C